MATSTLLGCMRTEIRRRNYSYKTEQAYTRWVIRYINFFNLRHPSKLREEEVVRYLNYLAEEQNVAASTQNQALCALLFLYEHVLGNPLRELNNFKYAERLSTQ